MGAETKGSGTTKMKDGSHDDGDTYSRYEKALEDGKADGIKKSLVVGAGRYLLLFILELSPMIGSEGITFISST